MKQDSEYRSICFTLDQGFGSLRIVDDGKVPSIAGIDIHAGVARALSEFRKAKFEIVLAVPELIPAVSLRCIKEYLPDVDAAVTFKDCLDELFKEANMKDASPGIHLFVATDRVKRAAAVRAGFRAYPHAILAANEIHGGRQRFCRIAGAREHIERLKGFIPYYAERVDERTWRVFSVISDKTWYQALETGLSIEYLPLDFSVEDPVFLRFDTKTRREVKKLDGYNLLYADEDKVLVALTASDIQDIPLHGIHGHMQLLLPQPDLFRPGPTGSSASQQAQTALAHWPELDIKLSWRKHDFEIPFELFTYQCPVSATDFQQIVDRYNGNSDLDSTGPVVSRHVLHPDNQRVVNGLVKELNDIGYCSYKHNFDYAGSTYHNVIADLPGTGIFQIHPDILKDIREIFWRHPLPDPPEPWLKEIAGVIGHEWLEQPQWREYDPLGLRKAMESIFLCYPWYPWWRKLCPLAGPGAELVLVGCHLDSTATYDNGFDPMSDPAPGTDDDASGIAATLAIAKHFYSKLRGKLRHTVRFCFFNAEESGLVGSQAYAAWQKSLNAPIRAVACMDMIGYNSDVNRVFEVHAGYTDPAIRDISVPIADTIASWATTLGALYPAQIYKGTNGGSGTDRNVFDGAINRSDHASFHQQGYPAVVVSEDFFVNLPTEPGADPNPHYHKGSDTFIDSAFAADITCAVAHAVKELSQ